uniref:F5/8 type C domain-containing protein n=1 Tax=Chromera velia CCMP2878 TaxID=1169474 RepID=A0A0G4EYT8_9ALVE|eukprot:Cvel_14226.t1-p1 / transcript=Cvel_14226.t1 / gene=Cvel_14226 / organism=Chromera_velia_CCMP2878 / gene_product=Inactive carboxypeptidase-like protein X2, putative / transcript_product=Inactive carboxypeptidase-like protein X2, putative / location=Cvel_scaffold1003:46867-48056(-) / protein_length=368 / sequence_SO=supercontig / SO=protein_coding / is_pseudo=false
MSPYSKVNLTMQSHKIGAIDSQVDRILPAALPQEVADRRRLSGRALCQDLDLWLEERSGNVCHRVSLDTVRSSANFMMCLGAALQKRFQAKTVMIIDSRRREFLREDVPVPLVDDCKAAANAGGCVALVDVDELVGVIADEHMQHGSSAAHSASSTGFRLTREAAFNRILAFLRLVNVRPANSRSAFLLVVLCSRSTYVVQRLANVAGLRLQVTDELYNPDDTDVHRRVIEPYDRNRPAFARVGQQHNQSKLYAKGEWVPRNGHSQYGDWLQINCPALSKIVGIVVQGRGDGAAQSWVTRLTVTVNTEDAEFGWMPVDNGCHFPASSDNDTPVTILFTNPVVARCVRIHCLAWHGGYICLRAGLLRRI